MKTNSNEQSKEAEEFEGMINERADKVFEILKGLKRSYAHEILRRASFKMDVNSVVTAVSE